MYMLTHASEDFRNNTLSFLLKESHELTHSAQIAIKNFYRSSKDVVMDTVQVAIYLYKVYTEARKACCTLTH